MSSEHWHPTVQEFQLEQILLFALCGTVHHYESALCAIVLGKLRTASYFCPNSESWLYCVRHACLVAGNTGYCPVFKEIGDRLGPFDLSAIPIGAYQPKDFMQPMHIGPEEALQVHQDVRSKKSVGVHCCTFFLTTGELLVS